MSNVEKVRALYQGVASRDPALVTAYVDQARYVEHDPNVGDGVDALARYVEELDRGDRLTPIRVLEDGDYVVVQADGRVRGDGTFFDVFRFADGLIVEHWGFASPAAPPNRSGHTQADGPTEPRPGAETARTKALVRDYYETVHLGGRYEQIPRFMAGDLQTRHEPGVQDGVGSFMRDLEVLTRDRTIDELRLFVGQGDFVFLVARGTHQGEPCAYVDLYRVEGDKLVEHWGFPQAVPPAHGGAARNGMI